MLPKILSLISIVLLLAWMFYFLAGCSPLLILKHDDAADSQLVRGMFAVHYLVLTSIATVGALCSAVSGRPYLATVIACIAIYGFTARRMIVSRMDRLRDAMTPTDTPAIKSFRKLHITGLVLNVCLLIGFLSTLHLLSAEVVSCLDPPPGCQGEACRVQCSLV